MKLLSCKDATLGTAGAQIVTHAASYMSQNTKAQVDSGDDDDLESADRQTSFAEKLKPVLLQLCSAGPPQAAKAAIRYMCNKACVIDNSRGLCD